MSSAITDLVHALHVEAADAALESFSKKPEERPRAWARAVLLRQGELQKELSRREASRLAKEALATELPKAAWLRGEVGYALEANT